MMAMVQILVFLGGLALAGYVFAATVVPALPRMAALLRGELDPAFAPRERLVLGPRRVSVRVVPVPARQAGAWREAA